MIDSAASVALGTAITGFREVVRFRRRIARSRRLAVVSTPAGVPVEITSPGSSVSDVRDKRHQLFDAEDQLVVAPSWTSLPFR